VEGDGNAFPILILGESFIGDLVVRDGLLEAILAMKELPTLFSRMPIRRVSPSVVRFRALSVAAKARSYSPRRISGWIELFSVRAASF